LSKAFFKKKKVLEKKTKEKKKRGRVVLAGIKEEMEGMGCLFV